MFTIRLEKEYVKGLIGLDGFSYVKIIWWFDGCDNEKGRNTLIESDENVDGLDIVHIPAYTYAVFKCAGSMPDAFSNTYKKICEEFFPQNDRYEYGYGVEFEVYPSEDVNNKNYICEIWIAVKEK